jgi:hypothetical protein
VKSSRDEDTHFESDVPDSHAIESVSLSADGQRVQLQVDGETLALDRNDAIELREALDDAFERTREFVHTSCRHREDGAYVVERRGADSAGHRKVFESFDECRRLYERLPEEFVGDDVTATGVTGGRRHMLVWHFAEHPAFECELVSRQPLMARKTNADLGESSSREVAAGD